MSGRDRWQSVRRSWSRIASLSVVSMLVLVGASVVPATTAAAEPLTVIFGYSGNVGSLTIPAGVHQVQVEACGAQGGAAWDFYYTPVGQGGLGGQATATIDVTPGEVLKIRVGSAGIVRFGGWNGGGDGSLATGGGGGASDVRQGGDTLAHRVVVGGGGGGGGVVGDVGGSPDQPLPGGEGGGLEGGHAGEGDGGTQTSGGVGAVNGTLGVGGSATGAVPDGYGAGGGGGLYGGAAGPSAIGPPAYFGAGGGGSGLGDSFDPGSCAGNGWVEITYEVLPVITPFGAISYEGDSGSTTVQVPVFLSAPSSVPVTIDWATVDGAVGTGLAASGSDFASASGTVTFDPGETVAYVPIEFLGDTSDEPPLLWGEWGLIAFTSPTNAVLDTTTFFGAGLFIIVDDD